MKRILLILLVPLSLFCAVVLRHDGTVDATGGRASTATTIDLETDQLHSLQVSIAMMAYLSTTTTTTIPPTTTTTAPPPTTTTLAVREPAMTGSVWDDLAYCETGGTMDWATNTGNGYYGGLQFSLATWQSVGGSGYPHQASRETQIHFAKILQARDGWGAWPACSRKLGLR